MSKRDARREQRRKPWGEAPSPECASACEPRCHAPRGAAEGESSAPARNLLTFREIYRSRDGRMSLFADERTGHLAAIDASRLA